MALQGAIPVQFGQVFPHGAFVVGEVEPINDFEKSTREKPVQDRDKVTGLPLWQVPVMDGDDSVRAKQKTVTVKIAAEVQPVPPEQLQGLPFRPVEFDGLTVTPWLDDNGSRPRIAYSYRASGMRKPGTGKPATAPSAAAGAKDAA